MLIKFHGTDDILTEKDGIRVHQIICYSQLGYILSDRFFLFVYLVQSTY